MVAGGDSAAAVRPPDAGSRQPRVWENRKVQYKREERDKREKVHTYLNISFQNRVAHVTFVQWESAFSTSSSLKNKTVKYIDKQKHNDVGSVSMSSDLRGGAGGAAGVNEYVHTTYNNVCTQVRTTVYGRGRGRWASDGVRVTRQTL